MALPNSPHKKVTTTRGLLVAALKLLKGGWTRGRMKQGSCYCLDGALCVAAFDAKFYDGALGYDTETEAKVNPKAYAVYANAVRRLLSLAGEPIAARTWTNISVLQDWNDTPGRTQAEVLALVRKASRI